MLQGTDFAEEFCEAVVPAGQVASRVVRIGATRIRNHEAAGGSELRLERLGAEREGVIHRSERALLKMLPGGASVETDNGGPTAPQPVQTHRRPSSDVALGQRARVRARPLDDIREADAEVEQRGVVLGLQRGDAERVSDRRGQARRRERWPEPAVRAREVVTARDRARAGIDPDEDEAQAGSEKIRKRRERITRTVVPRLRCPTEHPGDARPT